MTANSNLGTPGRDRSQIGSPEARPENATSDAPGGVSEGNYRAVRAEILAGIKRAGLRGDPLEHSHRAVLAVVELQWSLFKQMKRLIDEAKTASDRLRDPSENLAPQIANQLRRDLKRLTLATWIMPHVASVLKLASRLVIGLALVSVMHELAHRDHPDVDQLVEAIGTDVPGYTMFARQNSLSAMLTDCAKYPMKEANLLGQRYCYVHVDMHGVKAASPFPPDWASGSQGGSER